MWCYRKLLKVRLVHKVTNEEVLNLVKEKRSLYASIKRRRDKLIGVTLGHEGLAGTILKDASRWTQEERETKIIICETYYK